MIVTGIQLSWTSRRGGKTTALFPTNHRMVANGAGLFTILNDHGEVDYYRQTEGRVEISAKEFQYEESREGLGGKRI